MKKESPCIKICRVRQETGLCEGCFRSLQEISSWSMMNSSEKSAVYDKIRERRLPITGKLFPDQVD